VAYAYNTAKCSATDASPFELVYGRKAEGPANRVFDMNLINTDVKQYKTNITLRLKEAYEQVRTFQRHRAEEMRDRANKTRQETSVQAGDVVLLYDPRVQTGIPKRCQTHWLPTRFIVVEVAKADDGKIGVVATIQDPESGKTQKVHVSRLRKYAAYTPEADADVDAGLAPQVQPSNPAQRIPDAARTHTQTGTNLFENAPLTTQSVDEELKSSAKKRNQEAKSANKALADDSHLYVKSGTPSVGLDMIKDLGIDDYVIYTLPAKGGTRWYVGQVIEELEGKRIGLHALNTYDSKQTLENQRWLPSYWDPRVEKEHFCTEPDDHYQIFNVDVSHSQIIQAKFKLDRYRKLPAQVLKFLAANKP